MRSGVTDLATRYAKLPLTCASAPASALGGYRGSDTPASSTARSRTA